MAAEHLLGTDQLALILSHHHHHYRDTGGGDVAQLGTGALGCVLFGSVKVGRREAFGVIDIAAGLSQQRGVDPGLCVKPGGIAVGDATLVDRDSIFGLLRARKCPEIAVSARQTPGQKCD